MSHPLKVLRCPVMSLKVLKDSREEKLNNLGFFFCCFWMLMTASAPTYNLTRLWVTQIVCPLSDGFYWGGSVFQREQGSQPYLGSQRWWSLTDVEVQLLFTVAHFQQYIQVYTEFYFHLSCPFLPHCRVLPAVWFNLFIVLSKWIRLELVY